MSFDIIGRKKLWFSVSLALIIICAVSLAVRGLNLGIDFEGGSRLVTNTAAGVSVEDVRGALKDAGFNDIVVQTVGDQSFQVTFPELSDEEELRASELLNTTLGITVESWNNISATFGGQVIRAMVEAIVAAWLLIIIYVSVRFEYKFAIATIIALIHDLIITVGVYSITGREVTTATVVAVLTILGYSLYDTIIIFDRVRENAARARRGAYGAIVNSSIMQVMNRSIITSVLTLLPVTCLFIFGGETLKDFAFALIVGITSGTYSSIFVAAPILAIWKEREKKYSPRKGRGKAAGAKG